jgi:N-acetylmuramic acid 6-phosphate etherase
VDQDLLRLTSEQRNESSRGLDQKTTLEILQIINAEDSNVPSVVGNCIPQIAEAVDAVVNSFKQGGRLFYFGAGTSGRMGILDASECPPTFGTDPKQVQGIIAGGDEAIRHASEGAEDDDMLGERNVDQLQVGANDVVVGIAASGRTPYVLGAMRRAGELGAAVVGISNNSQCAMRKHAHIVIEAVVGPEVVLGSTRMKAGTAQKLILNMITTTAMILTGKVYDNLMVDMQSSNGKLVHRAKRLIEMATGADPEIVEKAYAGANGHVKTAIVMILIDLDAHEASKLLHDADGYVRKALILFQSKL